MVYYQHTAVCFAYLTGIFVFGKDGFTPSFVFAFISPLLTITFPLPIHVKWVLFARLKVIVFLPLRIVRSAFYSIHPILSFLWIIHHVRMYSLPYDFSVLRRIRAFSRTKYMLVTWRRSKVFFTMQASPYIWWIMTFLGAVLSPPLFLAFGDKKRITTSFACQFALTAFGKVFSFTFYRTAFSPTVFEGTWLDKKDFATIIASGFHAFFGYMLPVYFTGAGPALAPTVTLFCSPANFACFSHYFTNKKPFFDQGAVVDATPEKSSKGL